MPPQTRDVHERFWEKVAKGADCWLWTAGTNGKGYGTFWLVSNTKTSPGERDYAHRIAYRWLVGEIPDGLEIDHLCRNRNCVNPMHLEPVTRKLNQHRGESFGGRNARKTHCPRGHPYDVANTYVHAKTGYRQCRICREEYAMLYRSRF